MCGICGLASSVSLTPDDLSRVTHMNAAMIRRGPDGAGDFHDGQIALAMRRLSIIDLAGGWQPLYNEDRTLALVANGEIYNFIELRAQLRARGHRFSTGSDCETILHLYEDYGADCVQHLRGMFAFALWDDQRRRLVLARDRMGEKPLYLYEQPDRLLFASELKALLRSGQVPFELDPVSVDLYFHYQYVPEPRTILKGVRKLDAAHLLIVDVDLWRVQETCYWRMEDAPPLVGDPAECIRAELETVSGLVIRSDVPVGIALSGGLDSSALAALAAARSPGTLHAFSVGYPGHPEYDEREQARALADHLRIPFHEIELTTADMVACFPELNAWRDDPIADISGYGYYAVMKLAREHNVPVMLQGQGGDELFWGYPWVRQAVEESLLKAKIWRKGWAALPGYLHLECPERLRPWHLRRWANNWCGARPGWEHFRRHMSAPRDQMVFYDLATDYQSAVRDTPGLYTPRFVEARVDSQPAELFTFPQPWPPVDLRMTRLICETYLRENGITQGDRLSMASSVELRLPLVDHRLVETVVGLRKTQHDHDLPAKAWFKAAVRDLLPDSVMAQPKRGFQPPVHEWHQALFQAYGANLIDGYLVEAGILTPASVQALAAGLIPQDAITPMAFKALILETWCRQMAGPDQASVEASRVRE